MSASESYLLATAAYNEGKYIEGTTVSIVSRGSRRSGGGKCSQS